MTLTEWRDHLETLGPDLSLWPAHLAESGLILMETCEAAKDLFARASLDEEASRLPRLADDAGDLQIASRDTVRPSASGERSIAD